LLTNMKIGMRLALGFGLLVAMMACSAVVAIATFHRVGAAVEAIQQEAAKSLLAKEYIQRLDGVVMDVGVVASAEDKATQQEYLDRIKEARPVYLANFDKLKQSAGSPAAQAMLEEIQAATLATKAPDDLVLELARAGKGAQARKVFAEQVQPARRQMAASTQKLIDYRQARSEAAMASARALVAWAEAALVVAALLALAFAAAMAIVITRGITGPLEETVGHLAAMARGDLRQELSSRELGRQDELGAMARALQTTFRNLRTAFTDVNQGGQMMAAASTELSVLAGQMADGTRQVSSRASTVAAAAEEMSVNSHSVAAGMEQATASLAGITDLTSQMTHTIGEIAGNSEKARTITSEANRQADDMAVHIQELGRAAQEIGKVTEAINSISSQTNLLALNATIEAARAGAAGKGFAVVAGEIKALAQQTAAATEDIKARITAIQKTTAGAVSDIQGIGGVIREVSDLVGTIATAIEEQSVVTRDIAGNLGQASRGVQDANQRVAESTTVNGAIARDIAGMERSTQDTAEGVDQVRASAQDLSKLAEQLNRSVQGFQV